MTDATFRRMRRTDAASARRAGAEMPAPGEPCAHLQADRDVITYAAAGYLGVPTGPRAVCLACGTDFGPAAS